jgi:ribokinase
VTTATPQVVVVGSINEDVVLKVARAPRPGETVAATEARRTAGGKGANQAVAPARAGTAVAMIGRVGDDRAGERMIASLRDDGVATELVGVLADRATGSAYITVTPDGENTIVIEHGANGRISPEDVEQHRDAIAGAEVLVAQLEIPVASVTAAVQLAVAEPVV